MSNSIFFEQGEANSWFERNVRKFENMGHDDVSMLLCQWMAPFKDDIGQVLEVGCGTGHRLAQMANVLDAKGLGVEPSNMAVEYANQKFPNLKIDCGFGDEIPFSSNQFDMVHLGFFLYLVDRSKYFRCISEADRCLKFGGYLSVLDFDPPYPYSNKYAHQEGVYSHKNDNSLVFVGSGFYTLVNKYSFSHESFHFNKEIDERVSLVLLHKEKNIYSNC